MFMTTRIAIFDDNKNIRESILLLLNTEPTFEVVGLFSHVNNCLEDIKKCKPEIILMDIEMPGMKGTEAVKLIKEKYPEIKIMMQTVFDDDEKVFDSICAGATSYILKNFINTSLISSIKDMIDGGSAMTPSIAKKVLLKMQQITIPPVLKPQQDYNLSSREKEVLACIVNGLSHKMIAAELFISYETVRSHVKNIYSKLQVASLTEAVGKAMNEKLV